MAAPFATFTSAVIPLPAENVDTDQIVPARYLKVTDKDGLRDALFHDWRYDADGGLKEPLFVMDRPAMADREILLVGDNFGTRLVARARAVGTRRLGDPGGHLDELRRHLPEQRLKNGLLPIVVDAETAPRAVRAAGGRAATSS